VSRRRDSHLFERAAAWMAAHGTAAPAAELLPDPPAIAASPAARLSAPDAASSDVAPAPILTADEPDAAPAISLATLEAAGLVLAGAQRSRLAEEWRVTATHLLRSLRAVRRDPASADGPPVHQVASNILMVTSAKPNEGKSFSTLNLCGRLSQDRMADVLLVDADTKPGALSDMLGLTDLPGLFDLVADPTARAEDMILATAVPGLSILPVGRRPADGAKTAGRTITRPAVAAIEALARRFSSKVVVLDTPPCLATSDASTLAPAVTQITFIVEAERTQRHDLESALELLRPCPNITLVLNKMRQGSARAFGEYEYYYG